MHSKHVLITLVAIAILCIGSLPVRAQNAQPSYFAPRQVLVSGIADDIDTVVRTSGIQVIAQVGQIDLSYTDALPARAPFPFGPNRSKLVINLYTIGSDPAQATRLINRRAVAAGLNKTVRAEPNYVVGRDPALVQGNPWSVGGSPWSVGGSQGGGNGAAMAGFLDQWAFGQRGVGLFHGSGVERQRVVAANGAGVRVAVFDTSPFSLLGDSGSATIDWISPTLKLDLRHPLFAATLPPPANPIDAGDHGLFVSGLIHAIAPASEIRLIRVLDQYGQGDLFTLCAALHAFISEQATTNRAAVINMSLGIFPPPDADTQGLPAELSALETAVLAADGFGLAVVAAAGNQAATTQQLPADYPTVIGVAGSTSGRGRSCFSNPGDIGAPGGDGSAPGCLPKIDSCDGPCSVAVISLALTSDPALESGYIYWLGTSFAAPFASGAAALLLGQSADITPAELRARLDAGAQPPNLPAGDSSLGAGIINLQRVLLPYNAFVPLLQR